MSQKGVTPIIATVLLLMMTVAAAGAAYLWMVSLQGMIQTEVEGTATFVTTQSTLQFDVRYKKCLASNDITNPNWIEVTLENTGTAPIEKGSIGVTLRDEDGNDLAFNANDTMMEDYLESVGRSDFEVDTFLSLHWDVAEEWGDDAIELEEGLDYVLYLSLPGGVTGSTRCTAIAE